MFYDNSFSHNKHVVYAQNCIYNQFHVSLSEMLKQCICALQSAHIEHICCLAFNVF